MRQPVDINEAIAVRTSLKVLSPGMYAIHYVDAGQGAPTIPLSLSQAPIRMGGEIAFICPEGIQQQTLAAPGDYLIANVQRGQAVIAISKYAPAPLIDKVASRWRIEPLGESRPAPVANGKRQSPLPPLTLTGHIERRGDVSVTAGQWLGDPRSRARLEGFAIEWPQKPEGLDIAATCWVNNQKITGNLGQFVGTRRRAAPIQGLELQLAGPEAAGYRLTGEAAFSDGSRQPIAGQTFATAPSAAYLVALSLAVNTARPGRAAAEGSAAEKAQSAWLDPESTHIATGSVS